MKTPQENNKTWEEEFDERFELESQGCYECNGAELIDKSEIRYPKGNYHCEYDLDKIKSFIAQALDTQRKEIVEKITELKIPQEKYKLSNIHLCEERNTFIEDILKLIENK